MALAMGDLDSTMEIVMKNIYSSCDLQNTNLVPTSKLIEFIMPYMLEDLSALESLKSSLDPKNEDMSVTSEKFYEVMNEWAQKITGSNEEDEDFIRTPSQLDIDEKRLPYTQSTPRASFGQRLLRCEGLLNLSNESIYNISASVDTKDNSTVGVEKTILEEQVKRLEHQLNKVTGELDMVKIQLTVTEEQNDQLHSDLERCRTRLSSEQQVNDHLQKNKSCIDELKEEIRFGKKRIEELNKKLSQYEKDNFHMNNYIQQLEKENTELEEKLEHFTRREQEWKKEMFDMKTELDIKEHEIISITKINDELKLKLSEKKSQVDQLTNENELLDYKKQGLEKVLSSRRFSCSSQYKTCLEEIGNLSNRDQSYEEEFSFESQLLDIRNGPQTSLQAELFQVDCHFDNKLKNGTHHLDDDDELYYFNLQNETEQLKQENDRLQTELTISNDKTTELQIKLGDIMFEKRNIEESLKNSKIHASKLEEEINLLKRNLNITKENELEQSNKDKRIAELEKELNELKNKYETLKSAQALLEEELLKHENKFNFETAFKAQQKELCEKNKDLVELQQTSKEYKEMICKLTKSNQELEKTLKQIKAELKDKEDTAEKVQALNENIEETASQVQAHIDNKKTVITELQQLNLAFETNIKKLQTELSNKITEVMRLKDILKKNESIKNKIWHDNKVMQQDIHDLKQENQNLHRQLEESDKLREDLKDEYNSIFSKYEEELAKNDDLLVQISCQKQELSKILEEVGSLKKELDCIKHIQKEDKEKINQKLSEYEVLLQSYNAKTKDLRNHNEQLQIELDNERQKQLKEDRVSEELFKKLEAFQTMLLNLETKISELENQNELLRVELERERGKTRRAPDGDSSSDCSCTSFTFEKLTHEPKSRSFEKQKITIDRLKEKVELLEKKLLSEKSRWDRLKNEKENVETKLRKEFEEANNLITVEKQKFHEAEEAKNLISIEKQRLQRVVDDLTDELKTQEEHYKEICERSNEKVKEISLKISQFEESNERLRLELAKKETIFSKHLEANNNNEKIISELNRKLQELNDQQSKVSLELEEKRTAYADLLSEYKTFQHNAESQLSKTARELVDRKDAYADLLLEYKTYQQKSEEQQSKFLQELAESKNSYSDLLSEYKTFQEKVEDEQSKVFLELTEKENSYASLSLEYKTFREKLSKTDDHKEKELMDIEERIKRSRMVLESLDAELEASRERVSKSKTEVDCVSERINELMDIVCKCSNELSRVFSQVNEKWKNIIADNPIYRNLPSMKMCHTLDIEEGIKVLNDNIKITVTLLELLSSKAPISMDDPDSQGFASQQINSSDCKTVKKFTLRPSRLILNRPESPDSPSIEIDCPPVEPPKQESDGDTANDGCHIKELTSETTDDNLENSSHLPSLSLDLSFQDAFPHVTDNFLEKLGLHVGSPKKKLSKDETEKLFTTFAIQIALDSKNIKERLSKQKHQCLQQHKKCFYLIKDISMRLRDHRCIGALDPINPVFVLLEDVRFLLQEIVQSAGQLGILTCENRMMKCWNLVTNYMALIKQNSPKVEPISTNRIQDEKLVEVKNFFENNSKPVEDKTDFRKKPKEPPGKTNSTKEKKEKYGRSCFTNLTIAIAWALCFAFLILIGLISIQYQCRMASNHQICPLDDFIKKIRVGSPPY
nr:protein MLP1-like isoform X2 [Leptinotarsa decemlineata]